MYEDVTYETDDGIASITIDRPSVSNAFRAKTIEELNDAIQSFREDDGIYAAVLTGADGGFCAGADLTDMPNWSEKTKAEYGKFLRDVQSVVSQLREASKPTVAAVGGPAIGAGCDFALACDLRIVGQNAVLRQGFVRVGLVPGDGGAWLLPQLVGEAKARELLLTGRDVPPEDAVELGLATRVADDASKAAQKLARDLRDLPAAAIRFTNDLVDSSQSFEDHCEAAIDYQWKCVNDPEHAEAVAAMRENRSPSFDRDYS